MKLLHFILINAAFAVVDSAVTYAVICVTDLDIGVARLCGALLAFVGIAAFQRRMLQNNLSSSFLAASISGITILVSYGLFVLVLTRNPMLQWPVAFAACSVASLLLGAFGYRRATKRPSTIV